MLVRDEKGRVTGGSHDASTKAKISRTKIEQAARRRELERQVPPVEQKRCSSCKRMLPIDGNFTSGYRQLASGERKRYPAGSCHECNRERKAVWRAANRERLREMNRQAHARRQADPKKHAAYAAYQREYGRMARAMAGVTPRGPWRRYAHEVNGQSPLVDVGPFVAWWSTLNGSRPTEKTMGEALSRGVRRAVSGEVEKIHESTIDAAGVLAGEPQLLRVIYPID